MAAGHNFNKNTQSMQQDSKHQCSQLCAEALAEVADPQQDFIRFTRLHMIGSSPMSVEPRGDSKC